jgi:hypothetical protein
VRLSVIDPEKQAIEASGSSKNTVRALSKWEDIALEKLLNILEQVQLNNLE